MTMSVGSVYHEYIVPELFSISAILIALAFMTLTQGFRNSIFGLTFCFAKGISMILKQV